MAEGRFNTPGGTAITRTEVVTQWFADAIAARPHRGDHSTAPLES